MSESNIKIKAIETIYNGYKFRSRLEARWAVFFDAAHIKYEYEQQGYELKSGRYLPDFWLPSLKKFVEIKPSGPAFPELRIYLAGKMSNWRNSLRLHGHHWHGPFGGKHSLGLHNFQRQFEDVPDSELIIAECKQKISECAVLFAWIDSVDCFGAFVEIGFAKGIGKGVFCAFSESVIDSVAGKSNSFDDGNHGTESLHDLWFLEKLADHSIITKCAQDAADAFFGPNSEEQVKCAELSIIGQTIMCRGDPQDGTVTVFDEGRIYCRQINLCLPFNISRELASMAKITARQARFEYGEMPIIR